MSLVFLVLKAFHAFESHYDWPFVLVLAALDLTWIAEWRKLWLHGRGR